ncbi:hypothetical protein Leryth_027244 [Lithospermum erythrorhizon]|nr:hypothetical protein Leryth_027244 [Lithospermum erythrorhizon]
MMDSIYGRVRSSIILTCQFSSSLAIKNWAMATTLNPNATIFVPLSYRAVEDFSDEWWDLVRSSPWFLDYWLLSVGGCIETADGACVVAEMPKYKEKVPKIVKMKAGPRRIQQPR